MLNRKCSLIAAALFALPALAGDDPAAALADLLASHDGLRGEFSQTVRDESGETLQSSSGEFLLQRPDRLRWATREPFEYLLVTDGDTLWRYDVDLEQINRAPLAAAVADTPAALLIRDPAQVMADYHVSRSESAQGETRFRLEPKAADSGFSRIELGFEQGLVATLELVDSLDQRTLITFEAVVPGTVESTRFEFTPPPGIDVIDDER